MNICFILRHWLQIVSDVSQRLCSRSVRLAMDRSPLIALYNLRLVILTLFIIIGLTKIFYIALHSHHDSSSQANPLLDESIGIIGHLVSEDVMILNTVLIVLIMNGNILFHFIPPFHADSSSMELFCNRQCCFHKFSTKALLCELECCSFTFIIDVELYEGNTQCRVNTTQASALANCDAGSMYMLFLIQICYKVLWHLAFRINIYQKLNMSLFIFAERFCKMLPGHFAVEQ